MSCILKLERLLKEQTSWNSVRMDAFLVHSGRNYSDGRLHNILSCYSFCLFVHFGTILQDDLLVGQNQESQSSPAY